MSTTPHLTNIPSNEHIMLLYSSDDERNNVAVNYINNGLKSGYHSIYASINAYDSKNSSNISNLSSKYILRFCLEFFGLKNQTRGHVVYIHEPQ